MVLRQGTAQIFTQGLAGFWQPEHTPWPRCYQHLRQVVQSYLDCVHSRFTTLGSSADMGCSNSLSEIRISYCSSYIGTSLPVRTALTSSGFGTAEREAESIHSGRSWSSQAPSGCSGEELQRFWDGREELCCPCCCSPRWSGPTVQHFPCCGTGPQLLLGWLIHLVMVGNEELGGEEKTKGIIFHILGS